MAKPFKENDRVILTGKGLTPLPDWPIWGSKYSCVGTITNVNHETHGFLRVLWDNGVSMMARVPNISHYHGQKKDALSPNVALMLHKRRKKNERETQV